MNLVYAPEPLPSSGGAPSIFLAGPTPRSQDVRSWRPEAVRLFEQAGFMGTLLLPEDRGGVFHGDYDTQVEWETEALQAATVIMFWIPRKLDTMPAFTTNDEWGYWKSSGKCVFGAPPWAAKVSYQRWWAARLGIPLFDNLEDTVYGALRMALDTPLTVELTPKN
jgi:hypothetical protein